MTLEDFVFDIHEQQKDPEFDDDDETDPKKELDKQLKQQQQQSSSNKILDVKKLRRKSSTQQIKKQQNIKRWKEIFCKNVSFFLSSCLMDQVRILFMIYFD